MVPVLPAAGRPSFLAFLPVPFSTTFSSTLVTLSATALSMARWSLGASKPDSFSPFFSTAVTEYGSRCMPEAANVAYESAMRMALGVEVPRAKEASLLGLIDSSRMPVDFATVLTLSWPTSKTSWANGTLMDFSIASLRVTYPKAVGLSFFCRNGLPEASRSGLPSRLLITVRSLAWYLLSTEMPLPLEFWVPYSMAAASTYGFQVEPTGTPLVLALLLKYFLSQPGPP